MEIIQGKENTKYLEDLAEQLEKVHPELAGVIKSEAKYQEAKEQHATNLGTFIGPSGMPSAPTLKADIASLHKISTDYTQKAKRAVEKLERGELTETDQKNLKLGMIYVPKETLETFLHPTIIATENSRRPTLVYREFREEQGWFELKEETKSIDPNTDLDEITIKAVKSWGEAAALGATIGTTIAFGPVGLIIYPAYALMKYSKSGNGTFFPQELFRFVKGKIKNRQEKKQGLKLHDAATSTIKFKFLHPATTDFVKKPILIYQKDNREIEIRGGESGIEKTIREANEANTILYKFMQAIYSPSFDEMRQIPTKWLKKRDKEETESIIKFISSLKPKNAQLKVIDAILELSEKEKEEVKKAIGKIYTDQGEIQTPEKAFVDKFGRIYPSPFLWIKSVKDNQTSSKELCNSVLETILGNEEPLTYFLNNPEVFEEINTSIGMLNCYGLTRLFEEAQYRTIGAAQHTALQMLNLCLTTFIVNEKQFSLKEPTGIADKIGQGKGMPQIESISKLGKQQKHRQIIFGGVTAFIQHPNGSVSIYGRLADMIKEHREISEEVAGLKSKVESGNFSQQEIAKETAQIADRQKGFDEKCGKQTKEAIPKMKQILTPKGRSGGGTGA